MRQHRHQRLASDPQFGGPGEPKTEVALQTKALQEENSQRKEDRSSEKERTNFTLRGSRSVQH